MARHGHFRVRAMSSRTGYSAFWNGFGTCVAKATDAKQLRLHISPLCSPRVEMQAIHAARLIQHF
eukprot:6196564-Pleurochrysis_carterae.AAC.1